MLGHFIRYKGKGGWVIGMPMAVACVLFILFGIVDVNDRYLRGLALILSSAILWFMDSKREIIYEGVIQKTGKYRKGINTFMWIEMRYWAIALGVLGVILLFKDLK